MGFVGVGLGDDLRDHGFDVVGVDAQRLPMCVAQTSERRLASKSSWLRISVRIACRFWLTMTNVDR
jgi:hypothetical protein